MKLTAILSTATSPLEMLAWSVSSLILRTPTNVLQEIIVGINGPDSRTGDTSLQDEKQKFLENLKNIGFPITVVRTWSRLGFSQPYDMCLPLCQTDLVLFIHDDTIVLKKNWHKYIRDNAAITTINPVIDGKLLPNIWKPENKLMRMDFPHINTAFTVINRKMVSTKWTDYYINLEEIHEIQNSCNWNQLREFFSRHIEAVSILPDSDLQKNITTRSRMACFDDCYNYSLITFPMGAWLYYDAVINDLKINIFPNYTVDHLGAMSWKDGSFEEVKEPMPHVLDLVKDIKKSPIGKVYKSPNYNIPSIDGIKPLVGVVTYKRLRTIDSWLRAWNKAEHYGSKLVVVHNYDGRLARQEEENIQKHKPDYYIPRQNVGRDIGALKDVISGKIYLPYDWNVLIWFTDDVIPMRKDFLLPLLREISKPSVGLVGGWMDGNVRTICFAIKKELARKVNFVDDPFDMESGPNNISNQIKDMKFEVRLPTQRYSPKYAWDCDYEGIVDLWDKYESQF